MRKAIAVFVCSVVFAMSSNFASAAADTASKAAKVQHQPRQAGAGYLDQLNLSAEQKTAVDAILKKQMQDSRAIMTDPNIAPEARRTKLTAIRAETDKKIDALLTPEQRTKLAEIKKAGPANAANANPADRMLKSMTTQLDLTAEQQAKIKPIIEKQIADSRALGTNTALSREERSAKMKSIRETAQGEIDKILTAEQKAKRDETRKALLGTTPKK